MSGIHSFPPYGPPPRTMVESLQEVDDNARQIKELIRENHRLRHEKALALAAAECERAESTRLRRENQGLVTDWTTSKYEVAVFKDAFTAAIGFYDCPCGSAFEFADGMGLEDYAALNRWLGYHANGCPIISAMVGGR